MRRSYLPTWQNNSGLKPNLWDGVALCWVLALMVIIASATKQMAAPFHVGDPITISLAPSALPGYALQSVLRLLVALFCSLLFTFIFGTWAAKSRAAEKVIIPIIDVLQSIPVLAFLSLTIVGFIALFPNSLLGPQCACIFLIFTAQAWNMALSFYQSLRTVPNDLTEAGRMFQLSAWQRFWRIDVPFSMPSLLWNMMMSMSASWFSLVASEAISVSNQTIAIPGIGSYIALAIAKADIHAVWYAIFAMLLVILLYDQLLFRPLIAWAEKFKVEQTTSEKVARSWVVQMLQHARVLPYLAKHLSRLGDRWVNCAWFRRRPTKNLPLLARHPSWQNYLDKSWSLFLITLMMAALALLWSFIVHNISLDEVRHVILLGSYTAARVLTVLIVCSLIWVPIGVWIGLRPRVAEVIQPIAQFLAAFPANLLFPIVVIFIVRYQLNVNIWTTPLIILGTQWYVLFNVIAGAAAIPKELKQVAENFGVRKWLWWKRLVLPAIFPYYITGAITAVGGAWNASIVAEVVNWGPTTLHAAGLGAYITAYTGNFAHTVLGVSVMCLFVLLLNRLVWRPLYVLSVERFQLD